MRKSAQRRPAGGVSLRLRWAQRSVTLCAVLLLPLPAPAAELTLAVLDAHQQAIPDVVLVALPDSVADRKRLNRVAVMDQINMQFVPDVLVIQTGSAVDFPNSDQIQHQVYSFSPAKTFKLSLYAGHKYPPVVFDRPGVVTLGCNIHDGMIGYIYVTDSPFFGSTDGSGRLQLHGLPAGDYTLIAWHPQIQEAGGDSLQQALTLTEDARASPVFHLTHPLRAETPRAGDTRWADY